MRFVAAFAAIIPYSLSRYMAVVLRANDSGGASVAGGGPSGGRVVVRWAERWRLGGHMGGVFSRLVARRRVCVRGGGESVATGRFVMCDRCRGCGARGMRGLCARFYVVTNAMRRDVRGSGESGRLVMECGAIRMGERCLGGYAFASATKQASGIRLALSLLTAAHPGGACGGGVAARRRGYG